MNKEEIRQFKSILRQGILRKTNVLLDYKFQEALLKIIKDYEQLETNRDEAIECIKNCLSGYKEQYEEHTFNYHNVDSDLDNILSILERGKEC